MQTLNRSKSVNLNQGRSSSRIFEDEILGKVAKLAYIRLGKVVKTVVKHIA